MSIVDLDLNAARTAQAIVGTPPKKNAADDLENLVTKALGVLQEQGVYAVMLYLYSRKSAEAPPAGKTREPLIDLLGRLGLTCSTHDWQAVNQFLTGTVCADLDTLLLVKQVWEQALIYARYGAKAASATFEPATAAQGAAAASGSQGAGAQSSPPTVPDTEDATPPAAPGTGGTPS